MGRQIARQTWLAVLALSGYSAGSFADRPRDQTVGFQGTGAPALPITDSLAELKRRLAFDDSGMAAGQLALMGPSGEIVLLQAGKDPRSDIRLRAVWGLAWTGSGTAYQALSGMLNDPSPKVALEAFRQLLRCRPGTIPYLVEAALPGGPGSVLAVGALTRMGDPGMGALEDVANHGKAAARKHAAFSLLWRGSPRAFAAAKRLARHLDPEVRAAVLGVAAQNIREPGCKEIFLAALRDSSGLVRRRALAHMQMLFIESAVPLLLGAGKDADPTQRASAIRALSNAYITKVPNTLLAALKGLLGALSDPDHEVARTAASGLVLWGRLHLLDSLALRARNDPVFTPEVKARYAAILTGEVGRDAAFRLFRCRHVRCSEGGLLVLAALMDSRALPTLLAKLGSDDPSKKHSAIGSLGLLGDARAVPRLLQELQGRPPGRDDSHIADALGQIGDLRALEPLIELLHDRAIDAYARCTIGRALAELPDPRARKAVFDVVGDQTEPVGVRANLVFCVYDLGGPGAFELLVQLWGEPIFRPSLGTVASAFGMLGDLRAIPMLEAVLNDPDESLKREAKQALERLRRKLEPRGVAWRSPSP